MTENSGVIKYLMRWFNMCERILYSSLEIFFCLNGTRKITGQLPKYPFTVTETIEYSVCTIVHYRVQLKTKNDCLRGIFL